MGTVSLRAARAGEAEALSALCRRSKAHWGYDQAFMALSHDALAVSIAAIEQGRVWVAVDQRDIALGVAQLVPAGEGIVDLDKFFVEPAQINRGIGRALFGQAVLLARQDGFRMMTILSDPHASDFYERMGARFHCMAPSDAIPNRELPLYVYDL
jgi:GNAT superfamily N-acetyltransferase